MQADPYRRWRLAVFVVVLGVTVVYFAVVAFSFVLTVIDQLPFAAL